MSDSPRLIIGEVTLKDFRCHASITWQCRDGVNLLSGGNGSGKTTLLEAVYMMAHGRSFRQARDPELVRWGESGFRIEGSWKRYGPMHVVVKGTKGRSEVFLQGKKIARRKDLTESLPVVVDAPQAGKVIDGVPGERRRWLDSVVLAAEPGTYRYYQNYLRALMQRSRLLRKSWSTSELEVWERQIVQAGIQVVTARQKIVESLNGRLEAETEWMESPLLLKLESSAPQQAESWVERLERKREEDARLGRLQIGPHCDRLKILFGGREIRSIGSRGQQKLAAMAIRLAECAVRLQYRKMAPLLLLDDCLEALDQSRQQRLVLRLCKYPGQILMTVPNDIDISSELNVRCNHLAKGAITGKEESAARPKVAAGQKMERAA